MITPDRYGFIRDVLTFFLKRSRGPRLLCVVSAVWNPCSGVVEYSLGANHNFYEERYYKQLENLGLM